ncbi:MAG TPA: redoxin domain-containing protein [Candidatus Solibacter sp.]|nr:redoxin domain-containing protein [Candidatus Solibacter sp.]
MLRRNLIVLLCAAPWTGWAAGPPQFRLRDTQGVVHTAAEWGKHKAILLFFVTIDCPVGNSYVPEMNRIHDTYAPQGVAVYGVQADPGVADPAVVKYAREYRYGFPLLLDPDQVLVRLVNATVTPQAAVLYADGQALYLGRIDNRVVDFGKSRPQATQSDVRVILDSVLAGKTVGYTTTKSVGCAIPIKKP